MEVDINGMYELKKKFNSSKNITVSLHYYYGYWTVYLDEIINGKTFSNWISNKYTKILFL